MPWEIGRSSRPIIELLPSVIRRSTVQKKCQKSVNTRENAAKRPAVYVHHEAHGQQQSIVLSRSFPCCSFLVQEVSQTCSQLIHTRFVAALASGLETRNQSRKRQEKNELIFDYDPKKFLDWENEARVSSQNQETVCSKISRTSPRDSESPQRTDFAAIRLCIPS